MGRPGSGRRCCLTNSPVSDRALELVARCTFSAAGTEVVCAVSGGADSLALLALATAAGLRVTAAHVDHGLRGGSAAEADVVAGAAERFGAGFAPLTVHVEQGADLENRARTERHRALGELASSRPVLTGHTADDQAETLVINLLRGAGPNGLGAMRPGPTKPMLALRRSEAAELCRELDLDPIRDPSNRDLRFVRNRVRHEVLPLLDDIAGRDVTPLLVRTTAHARAAFDELADQARAIDATCTAELREASPEIAASALRSWLRDAQGQPPSTAELTRAMAVVRHEAAATELSGGRRLARTGGRLRIEGSPRAPGSVR